MLRPTLCACLACLVACAGISLAGPITFAVTNKGQFGSLDLGSGAFTAIGSPYAPGYGGLGNLADGTLVAVDGDNNFVQIDRTTGAVTTIGATGINLAGSASLLTGEQFAVDLNIVLYRIDPATGAATRVGDTGLGNLPLASGALAGDATSLYFIAQTAGTGDASNLYKIDTATGVATLVGTTGNASFIDGAGFAEGNLYGYDKSHQISILDRSTGQATTGPTFSTDFRIYGSNQGQAAAPAPSAPVAVTGYSADVISDKDPAARFAQPFHAGTFAWFEAGAVDDNSTEHNDGLPAGLSFVSATGSGATYQLQPANAKNVLQLSAGQTGTLTLTTPAAYRTLYVLASSGDGTSSSVGSGNINFADGSTQAFNFNCFDWCNGQGGLHPEAVLSGSMGRADVGSGGTALVYNQDCDFEIYETVITIDASHAGVAVTSIDFTAAPDAYFSNIFAVSGE